jgi:retron-type reverse transcriptase
VVQTAAKLVLEPIFEADFEDNAYGYRPVRGAVGAVKEVHRLSLDEEICVECFETRVWVMRDPANSGRFKARPIPREVLEKFRV